MDEPAPHLIEPAPPEAGGWIRRLWPFLAVHRRNIGLALGFSVSGMVVTGLTPVVEKVIVDRVIGGHHGSLWPWLTILLLAGAFGFAMAYVRRFVGGRVALDVQFDLRNAIYEHLQRLDLASHDELSTGQLVSRASSDVALLQGLLAFLPITAGNVVMVVVSLVVMLVLSPLLTVVALVAVPALAWVALSLRTKVFPATWDAQQRAGDVAQVVDEAVSGVRVVKGFGQEDRALADLADAAGGLYRSRVRNVRVQARYTPALQAVPVLAQVATLALGAAGWRSTDASRWHVPRLLQLPGPARGAHPDDGGAAGGRPAGSGWCGACAGAARLEPTRGRSGGPPAVAGPLRLGFAERERPHTRRLAGRRKWCSTT